MDIAAAQQAFDRGRTPDAHRPARAARRRRRDVARAAQCPRLPAGVAVEAPQRARRRHDAHVARVPRQPQRAGAGRAVHRRLAGVFDAGAVGGPAPRAIRAAAHAGPHATAPGRAADRRRGAGRRGGLAARIARGICARRGGDARLWRRPRRRLLPRRAAVRHRRSDRAGDLRLRSASRSPRLGSARSGAGSRARGARGGAQGRRRTGGVPSRCAARRPGVALLAAGMLCRAAAAGGGPAAVRIPGDRAAAVRHAAADAADRDVPSRARARRRARFPRRWRSTSCAAHRGRRRRAWPPSSPASR